VTELIKVLLVGYDEITRAGLKAVLEQGGIGEVVGVAPESKDVLGQLKALEPGVVITNILENGGVDAVAVTEVVRKYSSSIPVIVLTQNENDPYALNAVAAGVSAYILRKNASAEVLAAVIQSVIKGDTTVISAPLMQSVISSLNTSANQILGHVAGVEGLDLTPRQFEVLKLLAIGETNGYITHALGISHETTRKHVARVVQKLGAQNRTAAAIIAALSGVSGASSPAITGEMAGVSSREKPETEESAINPYHLASHAGCV